MELSNISEFIKPELLVLVAVLYILGIVLKNASFFPNNKIPAVLVCIGILLSSVWVISTSALITRQDVALAIFTALVQGVLVAGTAVLTDQLIKQAQKSD